MNTLVAACYQKESHLGIKMASFERVGFKKGVILLFSSACRFSVKYQRPFYLEIGKCLMASVINFVIRNYNYSYNYFF